MVRLAVMPSRVCGAVRDWKCRCQRYECRCDILPGSGRKEVAGVRLRQPQPQPLIGEKEKRFVLADRAAEFLAYDMDGALKTELSRAAPPAQSGNRHASRLFSK